MRTYMTLELGDSSFQEEPSSKHLRAVTFGLVGFFIGAVLIAVGLIISAVCYFNRYDAKGTAVPVIVDVSGYVEQTDIVNGGNATSQQQAYHLTGTFVYDDTTHNIILTEAYPTASAAEVEIGSAHNVVLDTEDWSELTEKKIPFVWSLISIIGAGIAFVSSIVFLSGKYRIIS